MPNMVSTNPNINPYASKTVGYNNNYVSTNPSVNNYASKTVGYQAPQGQVLGASTGPGGAPTSNYNQATSNVQSQQNSANDQIEADYSQAMAALGDQEGGLRSQAGTAQGQIEAGAASAKNELTNNQTLQQQGVNTSLQTAEKQGTTAMQQARDLFRQTQQNNIAQLSGLGISSSSVSEALAERLGVETARRIAGVTGSMEEVRQNASSELNRINQYYSGKMEDVTRQSDLQKSSIQQALVQGLNQINAAKNQAAQAKAQARANLLSQVQNQIFQISQQQQQFEQSMQQWREQKASALTPIAQDPNYVQNLIAQTQNLNQQFSPTGFVATPSFNVDKSGTYTGQINFNKKPEEDQYSQLLKQAGI